MLKQNPIGMPGDVVQQLMIVVARDVPVFHSVVVIEQKQEDRREEEYGGPENVDVVLLAPIVEASPAQPVFVIHHFVFLALLAIAHIGVLISHVKRSSLPVLGVSW